jgi:hypothetical protein
MEVTTLLFCSALAVTPQRHDMDRKREEAGRMVRHKTLRIRQALTARSGDDVY